MSRKPNTAGIKVDPAKIDFESMVFYITWYEQLLELEKTMGTEIFVRGIKELCEYSFHGTIPDNSDNPVLKMFFNMARASIDANIKLRIAGKMGNESRWNKNSEEKPHGRKKKEEPKPKEEPAVSRFDIADDEWLEPTDENIAKMQAEWEQRQKANGESGNL